MQQRPPPQQPQQQQKSLPQRLPFIRSDPASSTDAGADADAGSDVSDMEESVPPRTVGGVDRWASLLPTAHRPNDFNPPATEAWPSAGMKQLPGSGTHRAHPLQTRTPHFSTYHVPHQREVQRVFGSRTHPLGSARDRPFHNIAANEERGFVRAEYSHLSEALVFPQFVER